MADWQGFAKKESGFMCLMGTEMDLDVVLWTDVVQEEERVVR